MQAKKLRVTLHAGLLGFLVGTSALLPKELPPIRVESNSQEVVEVSDFRSVDGYLGLKIVPDMQRSSLAITAQAPKLASKKENLDQTVQVLANLTLRDEPDGKIVGMKYLSDVVRVSYKVTLEETTWGAITENGIEKGLIALKDNNRTYAEEVLRTPTVLTTGVKNYLVRLLWTEMAPFNSQIPEVDYRRSIMNILSVIDNRASSGLFPQTVLGVTTSDSQFSGLTDPRFSPLLKNSSGYRFDRLSPEELALHYRLTNVDSSVLKKLSIINSVVEEYSTKGIKEPLPACALFFKNAHISNVPLGLYHGRDPISMGNNGHSYYLSEKCLSKRN